MWPTTFFLTPLLPPKPNKRPETETDENGLGLITNSELCALTHKNTRFYLLHEIWASHFLRTTDFSRLYIYNHIRRISDKMGNTLEKQQKYVQLYVPSSVSTAKFKSVKGKYIIFTVLLLLETIVGSW